MGRCLAAVSPSQCTVSVGEREELRIGFLAPTTGIFAAVGKDMVDGFQMYLDEHNNKLGGADVKFIVEDTVGKPDTASPRPRSLSWRTRSRC